MEYKKKLQSLCDDIDGAIGAFFSGFDGILIEKHANPGYSNDMDELAAYWSDITHKLVGGSDPFSDLIVTFKSSIIAVKQVDSDSFVCVIMTKDANVGRAKFELNKIRSEF